jgi:acetyltransferase-like isoleucine patch superfamily enzyme
MTDHSVPARGDLTRFLNLEYDAASNPSLQAECKNMTGGGQMDFELSNIMSQRAMMIQEELNSTYHEPSEVVRIMAKLTCSPVPDSFRLFPPFYTDFGANIHLGERAFINSGCHFQSQGGIWVGDDALVGHDVIVATLNHRFKPEERAMCDAAPVHIGKGAWIGSNVCLLAGVTIGDYAVVAAGAVVTKDVPAMTIVGGVPAKPLKRINADGSTERL